MIYETLKMKYKEKYPDNPQPSVPALIMISNTSSTCGMMTTYPLFLLRTKMQSSNENVFALARNVLVKDGLPGFYKGTCANLAKVLPSSCIGKFFLKILNSIVVFLNKRFNLKIRISNV